MTVHGQEFLSVFSSAGSKFDVANASFNAHPILAAGPPSEITQNDGFLTTSCTPERFCHAGHGRTPVWQAERAGCRRGPRSVDVVTAIRVVPLILSRFVRGGGK